MNHLLRSRWNCRLAVCLSALVVAGASGKLASAAPSELVLPETVDPGMQQAFTLRADAPFRGMIQIAADPGFTPALTIVGLSVPQGSVHDLTVSFRVPWDIETVASEFWIRGFALTSTGIEATGPVDIAVGVGKRVYESVSANGLFVVEMEFEQATDDWIERTYEPGFTGTGYLFWRGANHYNNKDNGRIQYRMDIQKSGNYALAFRSGHWGGDLNNDCWVRWDGGSWTKVFASPDGFWTWHTEKDGGGGYKQQLDVGVHVFEIAARSQKFSLDRMHIFNRDEYSRSEIEDEGFAPSGHHYE